MRDRLGGKTRKTEIEWGGGRQGTVFANSVCVCVGGGNSARHSGRE